MANFLRPPEDKDLLQAELRQAEQSLSVTTLKLEYLEEARAKVLGEINEGGARNQPEIDQCLERYRRAENELAAARQELMAAQLRGGIENGLLTRLNQEIEPFYDLRNSQRLQWNAKRLESEVCFGYWQRLTYNTIVSAEFLTECRDSYNSFNQSVINIQRDIPPATDAIREIRDKTESSLRTTVATLDSLENAEEINPAANPAEINPAAIPPGVVRELRIRRQRRDQ